MERGVKGTGVSESAPPDCLKETQEWFAETITHPLEKDHRLPKSDAERVIAPSPTLAPHERIELYHQQYWWRLLGCLQKVFPMAVKILGYDHFNQQIGIPYLSSYPPNHWALAKLGEKLPEWAVETGQNDLIRDAIMIDWACECAFWCELIPEADFSMMSEEEQVNTVLTLQPHVHLLSLGGDLLSFREKILKEEGFPQIEPRRCYFAIYRKLDNSISWQELSYGAYALLKIFQKGSTIEEACEHLDDKARLEAEELMPAWFSKWTEGRWFGLPVS